MEAYSKYFLSDNPFPSAAVVNPRSDNIRINGTIFNEEIFREEIELLRQKIGSRTNMIYVAGLKFDKGIGKSALIAHECRRLTTAHNTTSIYVRCKPREDPGDFCRAIVMECHRLGHLWLTFRKILLQYADEKRSLRLSKESVETLFNVYKTPPETLPLTLYTHITSPSSLSKDLISWLSEKLGVSKEPISIVVDTYLTRPSSLADKLAKVRLDEIDMLKDILSLLAFSGFEQHYFFLDQMEDAIMATSTSKLREFCVAMRRMLEVCMNKATIIVTLHPDSEMKLDTQNAKDLLGLAPLDLTHRVDVMSMEAGSKLAVDLSLEYLRHFRTSDPPSPTFPFTPEVMRYICYLKDGNIRAILQQLHECLKFGAISGSQLMDMEFILKHPRETLGALVNEQQLSEFRTQLKGETK